MRVRIWLAVRIAYVKGSCSDLSHPGRFEVVCAFGSKDRRPPEGSALRYMALVVPWPSL